MNRCISTQTDYRGKTINVSITMAVLGIKSIATGFLGVYEKEQYLNEFNRYGFESDFVFVNANTRINTKILDLSTNEQTDVNESGFFVNDEQKNILKEKLLKLCKKEDMIILSGSMPTGFTHFDFADLIMKLKKIGAKVVIDSENENLKSAIENKVFLIKPNEFEFETFLGKKLNIIEEIAFEAKKIADFGVENVIVSLGEKGAVFANSNKVYFAKPLKVDVKSTCGAGDSVVAGFLSGILNGLSHLDAIKLSIATSTACLLTEGTLPAEKKDVDFLFNKVEIEEIIL
jgi:1-phosphofructokinase